MAHDLKVDQRMQALFAAEQNAAAVVKGAKEKKAARLKQAKVEAEAEIAAYKQQRESLFQAFAKECLGDTGAHSKELARASEMELASIKVAVEKNKDAVIAG
eukprot:CAMPEP_0174696826 /NCGR_PEP_ID=MMETSP1094-20130205/2880_1 /TAXON_ID=156173 /ORGANISM="Chrysochromulina brevifilum, Strain UTEX LB 985" /LENGTH=101 /DNA_ID=CAMNT_0015893691 /DNA_START=39 /DNA_END=340 /DNA_ORIENTATION=+